LTCRRSPTNDARYLLVAGAGVYEAGTLPGLLWAVLRHRLWHWWRGDGWVD
jgi:hypothetical protein